MNRKNVIKYVISAAVAIWLLYYTFNGVKWEDFISGMKACRWGLVLVSMAAGIMAFWLRALRWRLTLLPIDGSISRLTTFNAINIGYISNFIFPRIGEFVRCGYITKHSVPKHPGSSGLPGETRLASYDKVLGTVVLERSWDMVTMLIFLFALLAFRWNEFGAFFVEKMWKPFEDRFSFSLWWLIMAAVAVIAILLTIIYKTGKTNRISSKIAGILSGLAQGVGSCLRMKHKWKFFLYTFLIWSMYWLMSAATMWALPDLDSLGLTDALFLMVAGSFGWLVPVPGGFGAFHFIVSLALSSVYGIPFELGIVFATLSHESQAITMILCGGASYVHETFRS